MPTTDVRPTDPPGVAGPGAVSDRRRRLWRGGDVPQRLPAQALHGPGRVPAPAWAVGNGLDLYSITDDKGLFYHYPPLLAILLIPLADPPGSARIVFALKAGLWYFLSVGFLILAVHGLACALEKTSPVLAGQSATNRTRWWWALRLMPLLACLPHIGHAMGLGQVNILWLALLCGMAAALLPPAFVAGRLFPGGGDLPEGHSGVPRPLPAVAADARCLAATALGLFVGMVAVPVGALGPQLALDSSRQWAEVLLMPAFGMGGDQSRQKDLLDITATHNQGLVTLFHDTLHLIEDPRPTQASTATHWPAWRSADC